MNKGALAFMALGSVLIVYALSSKIDSAETRVTSKEQKLTPVPMQLPGASSQAKRSARWPAAAGGGSAVRGETKKAPSAPSLVESAAAKLAQIKGCYQHTGCDYPQTDPKSYELAVGQDLKVELDRLTTYVSAMSLESSAVSEVAREFLASEDGHVKEAALNLIATQPPSNENLKAVLDHALDSYDSNLTAQSLMELRKYEDRDDRKTIEATVRRILALGSFRVKQKIAELIAPILNVDNLREFEEFARSLPPDSKVYIHLSAALSEFRYRRAGG